MDIYDKLFGSGLTLLAGYVLWLIQRELQRRERKKDLATVLIQELWSVDWVLRNLYGEERASLAYGKLPMQLLEDARVAMEFPRPVMFNLLLVRGLCDDIRIVMARSREHYPPGDPASDTSLSEHDRQLIERRNFNVRAKAGFALQLIPELKRQLIAQGGEWQDDRPATVEVHPPDLPEIPPSPFRRDLPPLLERG